MDLNVLERQLDMILSHVIMTVFIRKMNIIRQLLNLKYFLKKS